MDISWTLALVPAISSGLGAHFGSYLRKKGENLATHEDIGILVDQVSAVTSATKEIEAKISNDVWDRQKRWELRREALFDATKRIGPTMDELNSMHAIFQTNRTTKATGIDRLALAAESHNKFLQAATALEGAMLLVELVCGPDLKEKGIQFSLFCRKIGIEIVEGRDDFYNQSIPELVAKKGKLIRAIREELESYT